MLQVRIRKSILAFPTLQSGVATQRYILYAYGERKRYAYLFLLGLCPKPRIVFFRLSGLDAIASALNRAGAWKAPRTHKWPLAICDKPLLAEDLQVEPSARKSVIYDKTVLLEDGFAVAVVWCISIATMLISL